MELTYFLGSWYLDRHGWIYFSLPELWFLHPDLMNGSLGDPQVPQLCLLVSGLSWCFPHLTYKPLEGRNCVLSYCFPSAWSNACQIFVASVRSSPVTPSFSAGQWLQAGGLWNKDRGCCWQVGCQKSGWEDPEAPKWRDPWNSSTLEK